VGKGDLTIERLLDEKRSFDLATQFEKLGTESEETGWKKPCAFTPIMELSFDN
jgi:hypothetical protein